MPRQSPARATDCTDSEATRKPKKSDPEFV